MKSIYNKVVEACETKNHTKAYFEVKSIDGEVKGVLGDRYAEFDFPNLIVPINEDEYGLLKEKACQHEQKLVDILEKHGVDIISYNSIDDFAAALNRGSRK